jgi:hypothetical protein
LISRKCSRAGGRHQREQDQDERCPEDPEF